MRRVLLSWSSGKDAAWALHQLRRMPDCEVVGLLTTFNEEFDRVAMHAVRRRLVELQANAVGLPLWSVDLPYPCSNGEYERRMAAVLERAHAEDVTHVAFGDLFLEDIRRYRERMMAESGIEPLFPVWCGSEGTANLAEEMISAGVRAVVTCVDPKHLPGEYAGRMYDQAFLAMLPAGVDPCGENGEFHTFCFDGPMFENPVAVEVGKTVQRDGFHFADVIPAEEDDDASQ
ncbi:MAG: adenine nucleotide alpha hydrolase [Planctomycetota bacterium]|nr:MAG: adenine nucleotide alpha hydrolase [Planctomycetota bacterium]